MATVAAAWTSARAARREGALYTLVLAAGTGSMSTEICASRLLAPTFGASTIVWANVIGLVLAGLAVGYWLGGRLADRHGRPEVLGAIVVAASLAVAAIPFVSRPFLGAAADALDRLQVGATIGSFFGALVLFAPPVLLLGMVAPFAIRLALVDVTRAGTVAGRIFALSTAGSLAGTFLSALVTIPFAGTQRTLLGTAALLAVAASLLLGARWLVLAVLLAALVALPPGRLRPGHGVLFERESPYQLVRVVAEGGVRRLYLNEGFAIHSEWRRDSVLTGNEWDMFLIAPALLGRAVDRVAILGNAGGTTARAYGVFYPRARIDGVEIDPVVSEAGRRYLGLGDNRRLRVITADARPFLRRTDARYDVIAVDAYRQPYVPFYLATQQFFQLARAHLRPGGVIALNVATVPNDHRLARGIAGTLASVFPQVRTWQPLALNQLVVGFDRPVAESTLRRRLLAAPRLRTLTTLAARGLRLSSPSADPWTDDRAPVEWVTDRMIVETAVRGGRPEQQLLPTAP
jgi:spermidine synthase